MGSSSQKPSGGRVGSVLGRYRLESLLAGGGMGEVYRAVELGGSRQVALKVLSDVQARDPGLVARFQREWHVLREVVHPNVVALLDWPNERVVPPYFVMELLEGETLETRLARVERLELHEALELFAQLAEGLGAVHAAGIVHRDLKPENVFLCRASRPCAKLIDFGLARVLASQITGTGMLVGTPSYVAPEQAAGDPVDARADVYALGLVLYRALVGHHPFANEDPVTTLGHQLFSPPPPMAWLHEGVPEGVETLVRRMLRKRPEQRPSSMGSIVTVLRRLERGEPDPLAPLGRLIDERPDRYEPRNPLAESLVARVLSKKGFRPEPS